MNENKLKNLLQITQQKGLKIATAESCTGGLVGAAITEIPGSSAIYDSGFVTYSYAAKETLLDVQAETLLEHGAVSHQVALEMASGALQNSAADIAVAITGIAGPDGGLPDKPVGTVCFAWGDRSNLNVVTECFDGDRKQVRSQAAERAIDALIEAVEKH